MIKTLKTISLLLSYPTRELKEAAGELKSAIAEEALLNERSRALMAKLAENIADLDLYDAQERYVFLFDRSRTLSLHLFEHIHGESRDRGQAMVDLMRMYEQNGYAIDARELPDHLPLFLEYLSTRPLDEARELLGQTAHIVAALRKRLRNRKSVYAGAFAALEEMAPGKAEENLVEEILTEPDHDPDDLKALDEIWEEEVVTFGGNAGESACGPDRIQRQLRAHKRNPENTPTASL